MKRQILIILSSIIILSTICIAAVPMIDPETDDPIGRKEVEEWSESFEEFLKKDLPKQVDESIIMRCEEIIQTKKKDDGSVSLVLPSSE